MVKAKISNPEAIEIEITMRYSVRAWKEIRDALKRGMQGNWHETVDEFKGELQDIVAEIEKTMEPS
jgi:hypothetical protein